MWRVLLPWPEVRSYREAEFTRLERMLGGSDDAAHCRP